ncbi:LysM peptidoglycan-binding domain-containing protein [Candidatus Parcubacteria bacterium]|nr:LysM peptidoglycan-binding domain-containing protein [Candidatus Parcubacteria bacterium]
MRLSFLAANLAVFGIVGILVAANKPSNQANYSSSFVAAETQKLANPLDKLSSADIAVNIARAANLPEENAVTNKADTVRVSALSVASDDDKLIAKPQIISEALKSKKDIKSYKVVEGDTVTSIAKKFDVSSDTIRLSNGLSGDTVAIGTTLVISPVNGLVYTVKSGDTPGTIAAKYRADRNLLIAFNDAELTGKFKVGDRIVIPDGLEPPAQNTYNYASARGSAFSFGLTPVYRANAYDYGWCTWHAANRRAQTGNPIPSNLGNAISWLGGARAAGLPTGTAPRAGAVLYHLNIGGLGHVAYVESVNSNGSFLVSDMNYPYWGQVTYRTVPASETGNYRFIY